MHNSESIQEAALDNQQQESLKSILSAEEISDTEKQRKEDVGVGVANRRYYYQREQMAAALELILSILDAKAAGKTSYTFDEPIDLLRSFAEDCENAAQMHQTNRPLHDVSEKHRDRNQEDHHMNQPEIPFSLPKAAPSPSATAQFSSARWSRRTKPSTIR